MKRISVLVTSIVVLIMLFFVLSTNTASAHTTSTEARTTTTTTTHYMGEKAGRPVQGKSKVRHLSITSNCDVNPNYAPNGYDVLCAVESDAVPCLRIHSFDWSSITTCVPPGTILALHCQIQGNTVNGNSWWDLVDLDSENAGWVADGYMDTAWTNNTGSPTISTCAPGY